MFIYLVLSPCSHYLGVALGLKGNTQAEFWDAFFKTPPSPTHCSSYCSCLSVPNTLRVPACSAQRECHTLLGLHFLVLQPGKGLKGKKVGEGGTHLKYLPAQGSQPCDNCYGMSTNSILYICSDFIVIYSNTNTIYSKH